MRLLLLALVLAPAAAAIEPCGISLTGTSSPLVRPGQEFSLYGDWGAERGSKLPVINRGGMYELEVVSWKPDEIRVRAPKTLSPGHYRVGVYCNPLTEGGSYGSSFMEVDVLEAAAPAEAAGTAPAGEEAPGGEVPGVPAPVSATLKPLLGSLPPGLVAFGFLGFFLAGVVLAFKSRDGIVVVRPDRDRRGP